MSPIVKDGELCTVIPVNPDLLVEGDVVLCKVGGNEYLHLIKAVRKKKDKLEFLIGNNKGGTNGWTRQVFGKLHSIDP